MKLRRKIRDMRNNRWANDILGWLNFTIMQNFFHSIHSRIQAAWPILQAWWWGGLLLPFAITRLALILAAKFALDNFQPNPTYAEFASRGWLHSKVFLIDIWTHWDAGYYLQIIKEGYFSNGSLENSFSNVAFFPLYPYLVKWLAWLGYGWTGNKVPDSLLLLTGILLSNGLFLASMVLLRRAALRHLGFSEATAGKAIALVFAFPTSFIFSCFYTESLFLFLTLAGFTAALERRWAWAGTLAALVVLTRVQGMLAAFAFLLVYLQQRGWKLPAVRLDVAWLGLAPLALVGHLFDMYRVTGNFFAPFLAQAAWGRGKYGFWEGLRLQLEAPILDVYKLDAFFGLVFLLCGIFILWKWQNKALGVYTVLMVLTPLSTGMLISVQRFMLVVFPVFLYLAAKLKSPANFDLARGLGFALQVVYFAGWVNYYWIV